MATECKKLLSKGAGSRVESRNKKPWGSTQGCKPSDSAESSDGKSDVSILAYAPDLYKRNGASMSDSGFIALPRSLLEDPKWLGMKMKYQRVFLTILTSAVYKPTKWDIQGNSIILMPGQLCISLRRLVEKCNENTKFKTELIDKNIVERAVSLFSQFHFVRQEERHGITILTVTIPLTYDTQKTQIETQRETIPRHNRDTNKQSNKVNKSVCIQDPVDLETRARENGEMEMNDEKKEMIEFAQNIPQSVEKKYAEGGVVAVHLDEIITRSVRENKNWSSKEIQESWKILVAYAGPIRGAYDFIQGTIKNLRTKKRSQNANTETTKKGKEKWIHPQSRKDRILK
jgi:predicted small secreted protein